MGIRIGVRGAMLAGLGLLAVPGVQAQVVPGHLELHWGDPVPQSAQAPRFKASLALDNGARLALDPAQARRGAGDLYTLSGRRVAVQFVPDKSTGGRRIEAIVAADDPDTGRPHGLTGDRGLAKATLGSTRWITLACRFKDIAEEQKPIEFFREVYGDAPGQLGHYWREVSYNRINLAGSDAKGWYELPQPRSHYVPEDGSADLKQLFEDCTAAADAEVDFASVVGVNMMFNGDLDGYAWGGSQCAERDGAFRCLSSTWNPPWSFQNLAPLAHEMGHGYGLPHSDNSDGDTDTYDNPWDVMSDSWGNAVVHDDYGSLPKHVNILQRDRLGWVDPARKRTIQWGGAPVRVWLDYASLASASNMQMVLLETPPPPDPYRGTWYTVEARTRTGHYEANLAGTAVIIHALGGSYERDIAQSQDADWPAADRSYNEGSMFTVGEIWISPDGLYGVYVESATPTGFVVVVYSSPHATGGPGPRRLRR